MMNKKLLIGDYYSQLALLNTLKLRGVDITDFNTLQSIIKNDSQYQILFKENYPTSVKIGLTLKLKAELEYQLERSSGIQEQCDINDLKNMMQQMLEQQKPITIKLDESSLKEIKTLSDDLKPMNKALKYKKAKVKEIDTEEQIRESIRARKILKSRS